MSCLKSILFVEDSEIKAEGILVVLKQFVPLDSITRARSYTAGLRLLEDNDYDLIVLDMTLPIYDVNDSDSGYEHLSLGGKIILGEMQLLNLETKVIVVTQYDSFDDIEKKRTLTFAQLAEDIFTEFPELFLGAVHYESEAVGWRERLIKLLKEV